MVRTATPDLRSSSTWRASNGVGNAFRPGDNPRVDAQFSAQYCVANAIARGSSTLADFRAENVTAPDVQALVDRVTCIGDPALDARGHSAVDVTLNTGSGEEYHRRLDVPPGFPGNALSEGEHLARFEDCLRYAPWRPSERQVSVFLDSVDDLQRLADARSLIDCLIYTLGGPWDAGIQSIISRRKLP
jgi:2-methylcitrate dehydratase PrpD